MQNTWLVSISQKICNERVKAMPFALYSAITLWFKTKSLIAFFNISKVEKSCPCYQEDIFLSRRNESTILFFISYYLCRLKSNILSVENLTSSNKISSHFKQYITMILYRKNEFSDKRKHQVYKIQVYNKPFGSKISFFSVNIFFIEKN